MERKLLSGIMLTLLLIGMLTLAFNVQRVKASETICIRADGSVYPDTAPISSVDNVTYTFSDNIYDSIVVERNNIVVDGAGYTLQGTGALYSKGISLTDRSNVTIKNTEIKSFYYGIWLNMSSSNVISGNNITENNEYGVYLHYHSNYNSISGNNMTANRRLGISFVASSNNIVSGNNITNNGIGIWMISSSNNNISENNIEANLYFGIQFGGFWSSNNSISGNDIINSGLGITVECSSSNRIYGNNITANLQGGIQLISSSSNSIYANSITASERGAGIWARLFSDSNSIFGNNITDNAEGIFLDDDCSNNILFANNIEGNLYCGIGFYKSSNNSIYHNNFVNNYYEQTYTYNSVNVWDDGYPSGGNCWSDYSEIYPTVKDEKRGKNQHISGSDGIWDHPYVIDANNQDNYPLVIPWTQSPAGKAIQELIETIETWNLPKGTENCLTSKLDDAIHLVNKGNENGATHQLMDLIDQAEALRNKKLTSEQADNLIAEAQRIINLIEG